MPKEGGRASGGLTRKQLKELGRTNDPPNNNLETYNVKVHYKTPDMRRPKQQKYEKDLTTGKLYEYDKHGAYKEISAEKYGQIVDEIGIERGDRKGEIGKPFSERTDGTITSAVPKKTSSEELQEEIDADSDGEIEVDEIYINVDGEKEMYYRDNSGTFYDADTNENMGKLEDNEGWKMWKEPILSKEVEKEEESIEVDEIYIGDEWSRAEYYVDVDGTLYDPDGEEEPIPLHSERSPRLEKNGLL